MSHHGNPLYTPSYRVAIGTPTHIAQAQIIASGKQMHPMNRPPALSPADQKAQQVILKQQQEKRIAEQQRQQQLAEQKRREAAMAQQARIAAEQARQAAEAAEAAQAKQRTLQAIADAQQAQLSNLIQGNTQLQQVVATQNQNIETLTQTDVALKEALNGYQNQIDILRAQAAQIPALQTQIATLEQLISSMRNLIEENNHKMQEFLETVNQLANAVV